MKEGALILSSVPLNGIGLCGRVLDVSGDPDCSVCIDAESPIGTARGSKSNGTADTIIVACDLNKTQLDT